MPSRRSRAESGTPEDESGGPEEHGGTTTDRLFAEIYPKLRSLAATWFRNERPDHSLQPTALVHEAYVRMAATNGELTRDKAYFFAAAARAMRQILVAHARKKASAKRGGSWRRIALDDAELDLPGTDVDLLDLDDALTRLALEHERPSQVVELRFFGGMPVDETAAVMGVAPRTVDMDWRFARAWLIRELDLGAA